MAITAGEEQLYYKALDKCPEAVEAVDHRDKVRDHIKSGSQIYASQADYHANFSVAMARTAVERNPLFARELYASLGMAARLEVFYGHAAQVINKVREMEEMDLVFEGTDQYEHIFRPVMSVVLAHGNKDERKRSRSMAFTGLFTSWSAHSKTRVNFPNRERNLGWRVGKRAQFAGKNALALAANVTRSRWLEELVVK